MFEKDDGSIQNKKCIYCEKNVKTCNKKPICSRKECKKKRNFIEAENLM